MTQALSAGVVQDAGKVFVRNSLVIITPKANPAKIAAPVDLKKAGIKLVLAAPEVPVGSYARQSLRADGQGRGVRRRLRRRS